jgi:glutathione synthase/RimK-type ligase-like ATP-grasp enzyme
MIGLVTYSKQPTLTDDDRPLIVELRALGQDAVAVRWDDSTVDWSTFHALVLRSTWDYHLRVNEFRDWLARLERLSVSLWNPVSLVRWNMHKGYLREMEQAGIATPRTRWVTQGSSAALGDIMRDERWAQAIVKPAISASATDTWRVRADSASDASRVAGLATRADVLVQELIPEVAQRGEWSLMFIGGTFSHATIKKPRAGDFRVQQELGGSADPAIAPRDVIAAGERIAAALPKPWLYTRIDGVETSRGFLLMEAECIEPVLFFGHAPGARRAFVHSLERLLTT